MKSKKSKGDKRESVKSVAIDSRLTELFHNRRQGESSEEQQESHDAHHITTTGSDMSWLSQFQAASQPSTVPTSDETASTVLTSSFVVNRTDTRPFWSNPDDKTFISLWKKSKVLLAKDCQKQRKAALRKTIRR